MSSSEKRGNWYLLTGLLLGLGLGLLYAWLISPVQYIDTEPSALAPDYKDEYRKVIALAYQANQDIGRAQWRALLVDPENPARELAAQAQRMISNNLSPRDARALAELASDMAQLPALAGGTAVSVASSPTAEAPGATVLPSESPAGPDTPTPDLGQAIQTATPARPSPTATFTFTPAPTFTPRPTATPPVVENTVFTLDSREEICPPNNQPGLLQVNVSDANGNPLAGIQIAINWDGGEELFYTGLSPEISPGYADFQMAPNIVYNLRVGYASKAIEGLVIENNCGWILQFRQSDGQ